MHAGGPTKVLFKIPTTVRCLHSKILLGESGKQTGQTGRRVRHRVCEGSRDRLVTVAAWGTCTRMCNGGEPEDMRTRSKA
jgi:hypothetical protein